MEDGRWWDKIFCSRRFILRNNHEDELWNRFKKAHLKARGSDQEGWAEHAGVIGGETAGGRRRVGGFDY